MPGTSAQPCSASAASGRRRKNGGQNCRRLHLREVRERERKREGGWVLSCSWSCCGAGQWLVAAQFCDHYMCTFAIHSHSLPIKGVALSKNLNLHGTMQHAHERQHVVQRREDEIGPHATCTDTRPRAACPGFGTSRQNHHARSLREAAPRRRSNAPTRRRRSRPPSPLPCPPSCRMTPSSCRQAGARAPSFSQANQRRHRWTCI